MLRVLAALTVLALAAPASAAARYGVQIDYDIAADGRGVLVANPTPDGRGSIAWSRCRGIACEPAGSGRLLHVADALPGSVYTATATDGADSATARSDPFLGPVTAVAPPRLAGAPRVNALVRPVRALWTGGWGREASFLQTQACRDAAGTSCVVIADAFYWNRCPGAGAVIHPRYEGWYLRVVDRRMRRNAVFALYAVSRPEELTPIRPSRAAAATVVGPIGPAQGPPASECGQPGA